MTGFTPNKVRDDLAFALLNSHRNSFWVGVHAQAAPSVPHSSLTHALHHATHQKWHQRPFFTHLWMCVHRRLLQDMRSPRVKQSSPAGVNRCYHLRW